MDLLRRRTLRAASLMLILVALASPAYAVQGSPIIYWTPSGLDYGDPDTGGGGINLMRLGRHVLMLVAGHLIVPTSPVLIPVGDHLLPLSDRQRGGERP